MRMGRITGALLISLCLGATLVRAARNSKPAIPGTITFRGTKYINCRLDPQYPFAIDRKPVTLMGLVREDYGTRSLPWMAATIGGRALFNPVAGGLIQNYDAMVGKTVTVTGYPGTGEIKVQYFLDKTEKTVPFPKAFYVHEIVGWTSVCGYAVQEDTGKVSETPTWFWVREP